MVASRNVLIFLNLLGIFKLISCYIVDPGPKIVATKGEVWPKPQQQTKSNHFYIVRPQAFEFRVLAENCDLLQNALRRYSEIINNSTVPQPKSNPKKRSQKRHYYKPWRMDKGFMGYLDTLDVLLTDSCKDIDVPAYSMEEQLFVLVSGKIFSFKIMAVPGNLPLNVDMLCFRVKWNPGPAQFASCLRWCSQHLLILPSFVLNTLNSLFLNKNALNISSMSTENILSSSSIWGILRGLETFSQLLHPTDEEALQINCTDISDFPRFSHRGLLVDTSRHFIPVPKIFKILDAMAYNKLNVFHWHITDDQSFPYQSLKYPELSEMGAYADAYVYSSSNVQKIIRYAAARGIRVLPEFDTPGHTRSWGEAFPVLLTPCYENEVPSGQYGPMDPTKNYTYSFLQDFFDEVVTVFSDKYLHLGGDEVEFECWDSNPDIKNFMKQFNITSYQKLEDYYIQKLLYIVDNLKAKSIVWEEVFSNGVKLPDSTVVHVWKPDWEETVDAATNSSFPVLLSSCWYLDHLSTGGDWNKFYECDPYNFNGTVQQKELILGGEACMWAEVVNQYNVESRIWPRASATAEKLWSAEGADDISSAAHRLEEHACRMNRRGIEAQPPNAAGFCM